VSHLEHGRDRAICGDLPPRQVSADHEVEMLAVDRDDTGVGSLGQHVAAPVVDAEEETTRQCSQHVVPAKRDVKSVENRSAVEQPAAATTQRRQLQIAHPFVTRRRDEISVDDHVARACHVRYSA